MFEKCFRSIDRGHPIGIENEAIDADLARLWKFRRVALMLLDTSGLLSLLDAREPFPQKAAGEYDNNTFIVQNFLSTAADVTVSVRGSVAQIHDLLTLKDIAAVPAVGREFRGEGRFGGPSAAVPRSTFAITVPPHSYLAFAAE